MEDVREKVATSEKVCPSLPRPPTSTSVEPMQVSECRQRADGHVEERDIGEISRTQRSVVSMATRRDEASLGEERPPNT